MPPAPPDLLLVTPPAAVRPLRLAVPGTLIDIAPEQLLVVRVNTVEDQVPGVFIALGHEASAWLAETATAHLGEEMAVSVCGQVVLSPVIQTPITGGELVIGGRSTSDEAEESARLIAGQTPCPEDTAATGEAR